MKTTNNYNRASRMATVLCAVIAFGTSVWAQSDAGSNTTSEDEVYSRLETLMTRTEEAVKYVAPSVDAAEYNEAIVRLELLASEIEKTIRYEAPSSVTDQLNAAVERLDVLASNIENEIRYRAKDEEETNAVEYAVQENNRENETLNALTFNTAYVKSLIRK
jgi:hypothetical protein